MRRDPIGHVELCERLTLANGIERRAHVEPLEKAVAARLHERDVTFVVRGAADGLDDRAHRPLLHGCGAHAEVLLHAGADRYRAIVAAAVRIDRCELHVHERRLARFVELRPGRHRVVPIEYPLAGHRIDVAGLLRTRGGSASWWRRAHLHPLIHPEAVESIATRRNDRESDDESRCSFHGQSFS